MSEYIPVNEIFLPESIAVRKKVRLELMSQNSRYGKEAAAKTAASL